MGMMSDRMRVMLLATCVSKELTGNMDAVLSVFDITEWASDDKISKWLDKSSDLGKEFWLASYLRMSKMLKKSWQVDCLGK